MLKKISRSLLLSTIILGSLLSCTQAGQTTAPNASNSQMTNVSKFDMGYLGVVTKYKSKEDGALVKIVKVNPKSRGLAAYLNAIVFLDKSRIKLMAEKDIKVGDYIEFQIVTEQLLPNPYAPLVTPKQGGQANSQGGQAQNGQTPPPLDFKVSSDPKLGNQMIVSVPKIIPNGQSLTQIPG